MMLSYSSPYIYSRKNYPTLDDYPLSWSNDFLFPVTAPLRPRSSSSQPDELSPFFHPTVTGEDHSRRQAALETYFRLMQLEEEQEEERRQRERLYSFMSRRLKQLEYEEEECRRAYEVAKLRRQEASIEMQRAMALDPSRKQESQANTTDDAKKKSSTSEDQASNLRLVRGRDGSLYLVQVDYPTKHESANNNLNNEEGNIKQVNKEVQNHPEKQGEKKSVRSDKKPGSTSTYQLDTTDDVKEFLRALFGLDQSDAHKLLEDKKPVCPEQSNQMLPKLESHDVEKILKALFASPVSVSNDKNGRTVPKTDSVSMRNDSPNEPDESKQKQAESQKINCNDQDEKQQELSTEADERTKAMDQQTALQWVLGSDACPSRVKNMDFLGSPDGNQKIPMVPAEPAGGRSLSERRGGDKTTEKEIRIASPNVIKMVPVTFKSPTPARNLDYSNDDSVGEKAQAVPVHVTKNKYNGNRGDKKKKNRRTKIIVEDSSDSESSGGDERKSAHRSWRPSDGETWMEPVWELAA